MCIRDVNEGDSAEIFNSISQRYRDRQRSEGRSVVMRAARRTRDVLDRYVVARRSGAEPEPRRRILWGRVLFVLGALGLSVYLAVEALGAR